MARSSITGLHELNANLDAMIEYFSTEASRVTQEELVSTAYDMAAMMKILAPVDTGNLLDQIEVVQQEDGTIEIRSGANYSLYVEFGTVKMPAQPFMRPAFEEYGVFARVADRHRQEIANRLKAV